MWFFQRIDPFPLFSRSRFVVTVGGGGKTSLGEYLAVRAVREGKRTVITTTTKIRARDPYVLFDELKGKTISGTTAQGVMGVGKSVSQGKLTSLSLEEVAALGEIFDFVIIEGDGAKGKPLKYPSGTEPVIPPFSDQVIVVAGLDALGKPVEDCLFRGELLAEVWEARGKASIDMDLFCRLFDADAMMKDVQRDKCTIFLNKYDACREREKVVPLAGKIIERTGVKRIVISSVFHGIFYSLSTA